MVIEYVRELYDFDPLPFTLVSNQDHITPITDTAIGGYQISKNGKPFAAGKGGAFNVGQGVYELRLDITEYILGVILVVVEAVAATNEDPGHDAVSLRIIRIQAIEIDPINQRTVYDMMFFMESGTESLTGVSPEVSVSRDGNNFDPVDNPVSEIGLGFYSIEVPIVAQEQFIENNECVYLIRAEADQADITYDSFHVFRYDRPV